MNRRLKRGLLFLAVATVFVVVSAISLSALNMQPEGSERINISIYQEGPRDAKLSTKDSVEKKTYIVNEGSKACYVRVKLNIPQYDGQPMIQVGEQTMSGFKQADYKGSGLAGERWELRGEYIYYRNRLTGNKLKPGHSTPAIYSAVRISPEIPQSVLELIDKDQEIVLLADAVENEEWMASSEKSSP